MRINHGANAGKTGFAPSFSFEGVKIFVGIPTRGTASIDFAASLALSVCALNLAKVEVSLYYHQNSCFVEMSRNKLIAEFLKSDCTHLWLVDDDMGWNADAILKMLAKDKPFVAGIGNMKTDSGEDFAVNLLSHPDGSTMIEGSGDDCLMQAQYVGGAFVLLKREVLEKMIAGYPELVSPAVDPEYGFHFFESQWKPIWKTEDYVFCERWRQLGGQIWCYPNIDFTHLGQKTYRGNYFKFRYNLWQKELAEQGKPPAPAIEKPKPPAIEDGISESVKKLLCTSYMERIAVAVLGANGKA